MPEAKRCKQRCNTKAKLAIKRNDKPKIDEEGICMKHKKQRGQKRKLNALLSNINQIQPFENTDCQYEHFHVPCSQFISSPKTYGRIKTQFCRAWLDKTAEIIEQKPNHLSFCKVVAVINEFDLWESQIIIFYDPKYYNSFWSRTSCEQIWQSIENQGKSFVQERHIELSLKEKGYLEIIKDFDYSHKTILWFYGDVL